VVEAMNQLGPLSSPINENGSTNLADSGGISLSAWIAAFGASWPLPCTLVKVP